MKKVNVCGVERYRYMIRKVLVFVIVLLNFLSYISLVRAEAQLSIEEKIIYVITKGSLQDKIERESSIRLLSERYYYPENSAVSIGIYNPIGTSKEDYELILKSLQLTVNGVSTTNYSVSTYDEQKDTGLATIKTYTNRRIDSANPTTIKVSYLNTRTNFAGNIKNFYTKLAPDTKSVDSVNGANYNASIKNHIQLSAEGYKLSDVNYASVFDKLRETENTVELDILSEDLRDKDIEVSFGREQFYKFSITQKVNKGNYSLFSFFDNKNIVKVMLPLASPAIKQEFYISNSEPSIKRVERDNYGNLVAIIEIDPVVNKEIKISGYLKQKLDDSVSPRILERYPSKLTVTELRNKIGDAFDLELSGDDRFWQLNSTEVQGLIKSLGISESSSLQEVFDKLSDYFVNSYEYDTEKANGVNVRLGAANAIRLKKGVCMEYSDISIAYFRALGIPTRSVYGFSSKLNMENGVRIIPEYHQWIEVYIPEIGWLSYDPTWTRASRQYIGPDFDHIPIITTPVSYSEEEIRLTDSYSSIANESEYNFVSTPILKEELPSDLSNMMNSNSLLLVDINRGESLDSRAYEFVRENILLQCIVFLIPMLFVLILIQSISLVVSKIYRNKRC